MDRLQQQQQEKQKKKRSTKRHHGFSGKMSSLFDLKSSRKNALDGAYMEGNGHMEKQMNERRVSADSSFGSRLPAEKNSCHMEFGQSSSNRGSGTPMKMLLAEEMSKEMEFRRRSPGVIGRLMGLDGLPTYQPVHKQQKSSKSHFQRMRSVGIQEKFVTNEDHSFTKRSREQQEFKDVFEVMEAPKVEKNNIHSVEKGIASSELREAKMAFIRQKFIDAKRFSTLQNLQRSPEFCNATEVLDSNKDLFLKFLQEPNSLFKKHLHDLQAVAAVPSSHQSGDMRVLKSARAAKHSRKKIYLESERKLEGHMRLPNDVTDSLQKQDNCCLIQNKHALYISHKMSKSQFEGNTETCLLPTRIVVLKPSHIAHDTTVSFSAQSSSGSPHSSHRKHREFRRSRSQELFPEIRDRPELLSNVDMLRHRPKFSREIARVATQQARRTVSSDASLSISAVKGYSGDESSDSMSGRESIRDSETRAQSSRHFYDCSSRCSPSSSFSAESSVSREAKKRLSERLKMTQKFQEVGLGSNGSSTLGEMLSLPDKERLQTILGSKISENGRSERSSGNQVLERWDDPLGISSRDGWNGGSLRNRPRSRSLSTTSIVYRSPKTRSRHGSLDGDNCFMLNDVTVGPDKSFKENSNQKEASFSAKLGVASNKSESCLHKSVANDLPIREIHVSSVEQKSEPETVYLSKEIPVVPEPSIGIVSDTRKLPDHASDDECQDDNIIPNTQEDLLSEPTACITLMHGDSMLHDCDHTDAMKDETKETSLDQLEVESNGHVIEPVSPRNSKEAEQPSPISVLEPPNEAELSSSECFESISAGLHELRMQLQLLKFDSTEEPIDGTDVISSSDELGEGCDSLAEDNSIILGLSTSVENREYLFLLDVLIDSGFHAADLEMLFATSYSLEFPVAPCVFDNLEKNYGDKLAWPRWERRLLFDRINSVLAELLRPHMDLHPWVNPKWRRAGYGWRGEGLADQVWKLLHNHGKEGLGDTAEKDMGRHVGWLNLGDDIDVIGREIEGSLMNDLLEEVVSGILMVGTCR